MKLSRLACTLTIHYWDGWHYSEISKVFNALFIRPNLLVDLFGGLSHSRIKIQHLDYGVPEEGGVYLLSVELPYQILELFGIECKVLIVIQWRAAC